MSEPPSRRRPHGEGRRIEDVLPGFEPENDLEARVTADPRLIEGLAWGKPRAGHPEGAVGNHVADLLRTIDEWGEEGQRRADLRFVSIVHDAMKGEVQYWRPRKGANHHAMRARRFAEAYTNDERLLVVVELHDRPYHLWRRAKRTGLPQGRALEATLARVQDVGLLVRFVELDASTEGKDPEPVAWLRERI